MSGIGNQMLKTPVPHLKRNGFDLSERRVFTMPPGLLLPTYCMDVNPGEHISISLQDFLRSQTLNTAAFARVKFYHQAFFVPYSLLWSRFPQFITSLPSQNSILTAGDNTGFSGSIKIPSKTPTFTLRSLITSIGNLAGNELEKSKVFSENFSVKDQHGFDLAFSAYRLCEMLGYPVPNANYFLSQPRSRWNAGSLRGAGLTKSPLYDYFFSSFYSTFKERFPFRTQPTLPKGLSISYADPRFGAVTQSERFEGIVSEEDASDFLTKAGNVVLNPFRLLAFQRIYNDFYRNDFREVQDLASFNVDDIFEGDISSSSISMPKEFGLRIHHMLQARYKYWHRDYFTQLQPQVLSDKGFMMSALNSFASVPAQPNFDGHFRFGLMSGLASVGIRGNVSGNFSALDLRAMYALERYFQRTQGAAGISYEDQILSHYGYNVPRGRYFQTHYLGGAEQSLDIGEVVSTADAGFGSDGSSPVSRVGDIAGRGTSSLGAKLFDFDVPEHGIIMVISCAEPYAEYGEGSDDFVQKINLGDFFQPEFDELGMSPVFSRSLFDPLKQDLRRINSDVVASRSKVIGFGPRYLEYKQSFDKVFGPFRSGGSLSAWVTPRRFKIFPEMLMRRYNEALKKDELIGVVDGKYDAGLTAHTLTVDPSCLDSVFAVSYDGTYNTDPFLVNAFFDVKAIRSMSVTGIPLS